MTHFSLDAHAEGTHAIGPAGGLGRRVNAVNVANLKALAGGGSRRLIVGMGGLVVPNCTLTIDAVAPSVLQDAEPFKVTWTLTVAESEDLRNVVVTLLMDDARVQLFDHATQESPPERSYAVVPGTKLTKTSIVNLQKRKGLVEDAPGDHQVTPIFIHARARNERDEIVADGAGIEVQLHGLARRVIQKMFA